jgi:methyl-accepting chemotaxis protein
MSNLTVLKENYQRIRVAIRDVVYAETQEEIETATLSIDTYNTKMTENEIPFQKTIITEEGARMFTDYQKARTNYTEVLGKVIENARSGQRAAAKSLLLNEGSKVATDMQVALDTIEKTKLKVAEDTQASNLALISAAVVLMIVICVAAIILSILIGAFIARSITKPLNIAIGLSGEVAKGDMRNDVPDKFLKRSDEIGDLAKSLDEMIRSLRKIVESIQLATSNVSSGSEQISETAQKISQGATEQAASAEEASSSMEEMSSTIKQNADNAVSTESISDKSAQNAEKGGKAVNDTVEAMKAIASKITVIEEIARQTNLLALNAAIEAARAGEAGKGFAVVASEVRKLAEHSQSASREISELSSKSVGVAEGTGKIIDEMLPDIRKTADLVREISAASREQSTGAEQVGKAIMQLDQVIQENAAASEELASMSEELSGQAMSLSGIMDYFTISDNAGREKERKELKPEQKKTSVLVQKDAQAHKGESASVKRGITLKEIENKALPSDDDFTVY